MPADLRDSVLFETGPDGRPALFERLEEIVRVDRPEQVEAALERLEQARRDGRWIAGLAAYELGYALEPALTSLMPAGTTPLMTFGIFGPPREPEPPATDDRASVTSAVPLWSRDRYAAAFNEVHAMIGRGDLYQVNLTMPVELTYTGSPQALWTLLRQYQPVSHGALVLLGDTRVLSRSPEQFFRLEADGRIQVAPMKGTAPRDADPARDETLRRTLANDIKNRAENLMIVDLMRNDLSRIALPGTVCVPQLMQVETYRTVHQMVSRIEARLPPRTSLATLFRALFPCGSITGAPKIAAMKAIAALEPQPRGAYCGSIGWAAPNGRASFNVAIRTLDLTGPGTARLGVGGGIVHDSRSDDEYQEALWKARFVTALIPASG